MKKVIFAPLSLMLLFPLVSCKSAIDGGKVVFSASSLSGIPFESERKVTIKGHEFVYYNVYRSENDEFVLKDSTFYIRNHDIVFGLSFANELACCYDISKGTEDPKPIEPFASGSYSIENYGFEISINKLVSMQYNDINIGKITHWC